MGILESVIVDNQGRLYFTDSTAGQLRRIDYPGGQAYTIASGLANPGGLALDGDGQHIFVGVGNGFAGGLLGNVIPQAKIMRLNSANGSYVQFATGLRMANGVVRAADGTMYASSDIQHLRLASTASRHHVLDSLVQVDVRRPAPPGHGSTALAVQLNRNIWAWQAANASRCS